MLITHFVKTTHPLKQYTHPENDTHTRPVLRTPQRGVGGVCEPPVRDSSPRPLDVARDSTGPVRRPERPYPRVKSILGPESQTPATWPDEVPGVYFAILGVRPGARPGLGPGRRGGLPPGRGLPSRAESGRTLRGPGYVELRIRPLELLPYVTRAD